MSLFRNNYKKLVQENQCGLAEISGESFKALDSMFNYLITFEVSRFELEVIKKDLIGLAKEAEAEGEAFLDKIGMPPKEFCDSLVKEEMRQSVLERILPQIKYSVVALLGFYVLWWCIEGMPKDYGITVWMLVLTFGDDCFNSIIGAKLRYRSLYQSEAKRKMRIMASFLISAAIVFPAISEVPAFETFVVRGNGRVLFIILLLFFAAAFFGNNYYWDKCSEKYNWR